MKKLFINIAGEIVNIHRYYIDAYIDIIERHDIEVFHYYQINPKKDQVSNKKELEEKGVFVVWYSDTDDLKKQILKLHKTRKSIYINTFTENLIIVTNNIKKLLEQPTTKKAKLFRNKKIQRELLLENHEEITINYIKSKYENLNIKEIEKKIKE